jgi:hypothetical protein
MPEPTEFEIKCYEEAAGIPWPDLSHIKAVFKAPDVVVETRSCVRCAKPVTGDRCPACRAHQGTYAGAS